MAKTDKPSMPDEPFVLHGGCGCHAIRYRINIPAVADRPYCYYDMSYDPKSGKEPTYRFPFACVDHCNDCRTHTGSLLNYWIIQPIEWCEYSCADATSPPFQNAGPYEGETCFSAEQREKEEAKRTWFKCADVMLNPPALHYGQSPLPFLGIWHSSEGRARTFCKRCGTSLSYSAHKGLPEGWDKPMDFLVGTMDKEDLDQHGWMLMDQQLWGKMGVSWVKDMAMGRTEMVCRSGWQLDQP